MESRLQLSPISASPWLSCTEYAGALHNMLSRSMAGVVNTSTLATLLVCYAGLALAAVYISRTELRLPTMQYASVAVASQVCFACLLTCLPPHLLISDHVNFPGS